MRKLFLFLVLMLPACLNAQLKFNELMSNNVSAVMDDAYNYSMWVELFNSSTTLTSNQSNYFFTDDLKTPKKWKPVSKSLAPGAFNVLWFERSEKTGHSSFKLNPDGGKLYMLNSALKVMDSVVYPRQFRNISFGRRADNASEWVYFEQYSPGATNNAKLCFSERCDKPVFNLPAGFYKIAQKLDFKNPTEGDTIYYTVNGSEPTRKSTRFIPGITPTISTTKVVRAKTFSGEKLSSDVATSTFFINSRIHHLPVVSIVTDALNLWDNTIGIYVVGSNGIPGNGTDSPANFNQLWDRPANFELFDTTKVNVLNQELDIAISGAWSRSINPQKSLKIEPRKKFGDANLRYEVFKAIKPNLKYKDIQMRNSGNDFSFSMMRDAFMQTLVMKRMDLDLSAYEPAVLYMNGVYFGIQNLREASSSDYLYSNYGLDSEDVRLVETWDIPKDTSYIKLSTYISNNVITKVEVYNQVCKMMDVDEFLNYMISEIYYGNQDWPHNNVKIWKKNVGGKWRWLMYDTDFGFSLFDTNLFNHNTLLYALGEKTDQIPEAWSTLLLRRLILNETFKTKLLDRFSVQLSSTFETKRVNAILDSLSNKISEEIIYHKAKWGGSARTLVDDVLNMKNFSAQRPDIMMTYLSNRFANSAKIQTVHLSSNVVGSSYRMNNEGVLDSEVTLKYFKDRQMVLQANPIFGYQFKQWEEVGDANLDLVKMGDSWKYFDGNAIPATNWNTGAYSDASWASGLTQLGYGGKGETTVIGYGDNANAKYPTAYFRKTLTIDDLDNKTNFSITLFVDDGAVVYMNGQEIGRYLLPAGTITFNTYTTSVNNGVLVTFSVPKTLLKEGANLLAVEVHQAAPTSSDLIFNLQMTCDLSSASSVVTDPVYSVMLTSNLNLKAIFEKTTPEIKEEDAVVMNELVANNGSINDEFGEKDDYIELLNTGEKDVNIAGWYLTDTPVNRILARIPATDSLKTFIPAQHRLILWADNEPDQGVLHLGFKLGKDGETILLSRKNEQDKIVTIDSVRYPALGEDMSYSRMPDGGTDWLIQAPTFNQTNNDVAVAIELPGVAVDLYPTLVSESFTVQNASGLLITLTNLTGKVIYRMTCSSDHENISTSSLKRGLYLVTVGNFKFKIIKR